MSYDELCRTCLQEGLNFVNVFSKYTSPDGNSLIVKEMIKSCSSIEVCNNDDLPKYICKKCYSKLIEAYNFQLLCKKSYEWLIKNESKSKYIKVENDQSTDIKVENEQSADIKEFIKEEDLSENMSCNSNDVNYISDYKGPNYDNHILKTEIKTEHEINVNLKLTKKKNYKSGHSTKKKKLKTIKCHLCPKMFTFYYLLKSHLESHNDKNYYCSTCQKYYKSQILHEKSHLLGKQFICDICSKKFSTKAKVQIHIQTHSKNRKKLYKCKILGCSKAYFTIKNLERHELCHSGTKNFMCHLCSKTFIDKSGLEVHLNVHSQEKKYLCRICNEKFLTSSKRHNHELRHKERNISCSCCDRMFYTKAALKKHMLTHTNEKRYKCSFCSTSYSRSDNRKRHEFTVHGYISNKEKLSI